VIPATPDHRIDLQALAAEIAQDRHNGLNPTCVIANASTVNTGAIDPLKTIADICERENLWMHVDGAFGARCKISNYHSNKVKGLERADSIAVDLHKWMSQQYDLGCIIVRDEAQHRQSFEQTPAYQEKQEDGLATGPIDFSAFGLQLSRSFKALRVWMTIKSEGISKFRRMIDQNIAQANYLSRLIENDENLELLAPTALNIVNFRYLADGWNDEQLNSLNAKTLSELQCRGIAAPSSTMINGKFSIRVANVNHRSEKADFDVLIEACKLIGQSLAQFELNENCA
jgi:aromatic-L-amino-acid/L-tryptophan decarboxylase